MNAVASVASDRCALLKAVCSRHEAAAQDVSDYLIRSLAFQRARQSQLEAFFRGRRIAEKLAQGRLPLQRAAVIRGGPSNGTGYCDACASPFYQRQLVMDVPTPRGAFVYLHADCFLLWDDVRRRV